MQPLLYMTYVILCAWLPPFMCILGCIFCMISTWHVHGEIYFVYESLSFPYWDDISIIFPLVMCTLCNFQWVLCTWFYPVMCVLGYYLCAWYDVFGAWFSPVISMVWCFGVWLPHIMCIWCNVYGVWLTPVVYMVWCFWCVINTMCMVGCSLYMTLSCHVLCAMFFMDEFILSCACQEVLYMTSFCHVYVEISLVYDIHQSCKWWDILCVWFPPVKYIVWCFSVWRPTIMCMVGCSLHMTSICDVYVRIYFAVWHPPVTCMVGCSLCMLSTCHLHCMMLLCVASNYHVHGSFFCIWLHLTMCIVG